LNLLKGNEMTTFVNAVVNQEARTANGMRARKSTANACVDLFFKIGASRGKDIVPGFTAAFVENEDYALRIAQWARDVRGGSGERELFRQILKYLARNNPEVAVKLLHKVPEVGRWDDLLIFDQGAVQDAAFGLIKLALEAGNGLTAKWMPRKGMVAEQLRNFLGYSPKFYRKRLVELSKTVEQAMCANDWDNINFSHVPSLAASRYKKAFYRNTPKYAEYVDALVKGTDPKVKVNAGAVYPYDVLKGVINHYGAVSYNKTELDLVVKQWEALENFVGDANVLPLVDVSGSMTCPAGKNPGVSCLNVTVSLGLYLADKNTGKFKDTFLTFSGSPELLHLKGNVVQKVDQMVKSKWEMNTDLVKAMDKILKTAKDGGVPQEEMPEMLLILSDMQFDYCARFDDSAMQMIARKFEEAGYNLPKIVFWNLNAADNVPVKYDARGVALISGFSPAIMKAVLSGDTEQFTPEGVMLKAIMSDRYAI
jgi:hypothetical protein